MMTRINVGILPKELPTKLLIAELREIKRIPNMVAKKPVDRSKIPNKFKLGTGHVLFFYDKGLYTFIRYNSLRDEAISRGLNVQDFSEAWYNYPPDLMNDYHETPLDRELLIERITERGFQLI